MYLVFVEVKDVYLLFEKRELMEKLGLTEKPEIYVQKGEIKSIKFRTYVNICEKINDVAKALEELGVVWGKIEVIEVDLLPKVKCVHENRYGALGNVTPV
ncbi:MAG: hypothetical protein ASUL_09539 [Candidatus Aramenus sulfurataquae]|uniref:Uncharacterized protein n=1 Tax=Candidatus Aramenus sulfurataquae TaxID=1326980 RepID=W7KTB0_9CREN|nr:MAG: hypothetical protein ASUL_09539 [Candidatus Aramenus sulfurataquae]